MGGQTGTCCSLRFSLLRGFLGCSPQGRSLCPAGRPPPWSLGPRGLWDPRPLEAYLLTAAVGVLRPPAPAEAAAAPPEAGDPAQVCHPPGLHPEAVLLLGASFQGRGLHPDGLLRPPRSPASHDGLCSAWLGGGLWEHTQGKEAGVLSGPVCPECCPSVGVPEPFGSTSTSPGPSLRSHGLRSLGRAGERAPPSPSTQHVQQHPAAGPQRELAGHAVHTPHPVAMLLTSVHCFHFPKGRDPTKYKEVSN